LFQDNPYASLIPNANASPGVIYGPPETPKPKDPPSGYTFDGAGGLVPIPGGPADPNRPGGELDPNKPGGKGDPKPTEAERTASFLSTNLYGATAQMQSVLKTDPEASLPTASGEFAGLFGSTARRFANEGARRRVEAAQRLILDNALTLGTGAAYTAEQLDGYRQSYFPQLGDDAEDVKFKQQSLRTLLLAARIKAGNEAGKIDEAMSMLGLNADVGGAETADQTTAPPPERAFGAQEDAGFQEVTDAQQRQWAGFMAQQEPGKATAADLAAGWQRITGQPMGNAEEITAFFNRTGKFSGDVAYVNKPEVRAEVNRILDETGGADDFGGGAVNGASVGWDAKLDAGATALRGSLMGEGSLSELYSDKLAVNRGVQAGMRERSPWLYGTGQAIGGFAVPIGMAARTPMALARAGAGAGALYGAGEADGAGNMAAGAATGGALGALIGGGVGAGASALGRRFGPQLSALTARTDPEVADTARAALSENVRIIEPMVNDRAIRRTGVLEANNLTAPIIRGGIERVAGDIEQGVGRLGQNGAPMGNQRMGDMVRDVVVRVREEDRALSKAAYDAAEAIDGDPMVDLVTMRAKLDDEIARLSRTPGTNKAQIDLLMTTRDDIAQPMPLSAVRDLRTNLRDNISANNLGRTRAEARLLGALEAGKNDIRGSLSAAGQKAWDAADALYTGQMKFRAKVLEPLVGKDIDKLGSEQLAERLRGMMSPRGNGRAMASLHRRMTAEESRDLAATFAEGLGRKSPDDPFSTATLVTQARRFSPAARETIFGPQGAQSLNNLIRLSRRLERSVGDINRSRTAPPMLELFRNGARGVVLGLMGAGGGLATQNAAGVGLGVAVGATIAGAGAVRRSFSAKALMNPNVQKWLDRASNVSNPREANLALVQLRTLAAREPALASEIVPIHQFLLENMAVRASAEAEGVEGD
jgi:hypothetical protein